MSSVQAHRLSFAHSSAAPVVADVHFHLTPGWYGLCGANGAGKTTLLRLIAGELRPDAGHVRLEPAGAALVVCPQIVAENDAAVTRMARASDAVARRLRGQLGLEPEALERWPTLSPGERKRWQIGAALAREPEILLLDEPTNHLDTAARELLVAALVRHRGVGIVVSHDRALLDALTTTTLRIHGARVAVHAGCYGEARRDWEREAAAAEGERTRARAEHRAVARRLDDARRDRASAERNLSSGQRMKDKNDHDARSDAAKFRVEHAEAALGRKVGALGAELERAAQRIAPFEVDKTLGRSLFVDYARAPASRLAALDAESVRAGDHEVLRDVHLTFGREDRIQLLGPNGAGKTTLVLALARAATIPAERILHVPQDLSPAEERALLDDVRRLAPRERGRVLSVVAALGVDPDRLLASRQPSPGEAKKAMIALGLGRHVWALMLDEPTNHLDLPSIERLEAALAAYPGALLLVTHDTDFARRCTSAVWRLDRGRVAVA